MWYTLVAVGAGILLGIVARGSFRTIADQSFQAWALLPLGVVVQALPDVLDTGDRVGGVLLLGSYVCLASFAVLNLRMVGMAVVFVGLAMNLVPIATNRGMPVRADAVVAAHIAGADEIPQLRFDAKHHLETPDDQWMILADIIPVRPLREVLSFGDLVMSFGIANVIFRMMKPRPNARRRDNEPPPAEADVLDLTGHEPGHDDIRALSVRA